MKEQEPFDLKAHLRHCGSTAQLYDVRRTQLTEGSSAGIRLIEVTTAAGLNAVFCENKALDLYSLRYKGLNIGFLSKNGLINDRTRPQSGMFPSTWQGGMLATCGLRNAGPGCETESEVHPPHGLIGSIPAEQVALRTDWDKGVLEIMGQVRESALFGHNLLLRRRILIDLSGSAIKWQDTVQNQSAEPEPLFLLYHFNFGYPFLDKALQLHLPPSQVIARKEEAVKGLASFDQISAPIDGKPEEVFFHLPLQDQQENPGQQQVRLVRADLRMAASLSWSRSELPWLIQWKSMKSGDYALGIEPSTSSLLGRAEELKNGFSYLVPPFGERHYNLSLQLETLSD